MADVMIDIEGLATGPDTAILTIAAQTFDPFIDGWLDRYYYCRVDLESQADRAIQQETLDWWAKQPEQSRAEAFAEENRLPLRDALEGLYKIAWQSNRIWMNGPTYDANILEHAFKSLGMSLPWKFYKIRDCRTVYSLWPDLPIPPTSHHALEDCKRQIVMLQETLKHFKIKEIR